MKYLKIFEEFNLFNRKKPIDWKSKFEEIYSIYQGLKSGKIKDIKLTIDIKDDRFTTASLDLKKGWDENVNLVFNNRGNGVYDVMDFQEVSMTDKKSEKGIYKISKEEYESYLKRSEEIDNWLDEESDKTYNKSSSIVNNDGKIDLNIDEYEIALDDVNYKLKKHVLNKYIGKEFEFECGYYLWKSKHENDYVCERYMFPIDDIQMHFRSSTSCYFNIYTKDPLGEKAVIWFESNTEATQYFDLSKNPKNTFTTTLRMDTVGKELSRREKKDLEKNPKFPHAYAYKLSPSKYDSIEFVKELKELLELVIDSTKNKD